MYIASEHIREWIRTETARVVPVATATQLGGYLNQLPWVVGGSGLDWGQIRGERFSLSTLTESAQLGRFRSTLLGSDPIMVFWYVADQPCIACDANFAMANIDQAFWKAPGLRYVFGASIRGGLVVPLMAHFAEYGGADDLTVAL